MKILHFIYDHINNPWVGGGGAVRAYEIYKRLSEKNHQITVVSGKYPGSKDYYVNKNFRYIFLGCDINYILSTFIYAIKAARFLKKSYKYYDIIIEDFAPWNPIFSYKLQQKTNIVLQVHQKESVNILKRYYLFGLPFYLLENFYPKKYKNVITVSEESSKKFGISAEVIYNGINLVPKNVFNTILYSDESNYVLFLGRIDIYHKGLDLLLEAFSKLDIPLIIMGKGKDRKKLAKMVGERRNIKIENFSYGLEKMKKIVSSKFLVMPSRFEGQSVVSLEAASLGKPIVVSDIPELRYVIENKFGISFKKDDPEDLKRKIKYLWSNENLIKELGENGKRYAKNFTWDKITEKFEKYLMGIVTNAKYAR